MKKKCKNHPRHAHPTQHGVVEICSRQEHLPFGKSQRYGQRPDHPRTAGVTCHKARHDPGAKGRNSARCCLLFTRLCHPVCHHPKKLGMISPTTQTPQHNF
ncbi:MAG: hypothetical protein IKR77_02090 [Bacteroidales bacterium]|nr:hypothetical protein [Bacteroidales bacterium]